MKSTLLCLGWMLVHPLTAGLAAAAPEASHTIQSASGTLTCAPEGLSLQPVRAGCPAAEATGEPWWALVLEPAPGSPAAKDVVLESRTQPIPTMTRAGDRVRLEYPSLTDGNQAVEIRLVLDFRSTGDAFELAGEIRNSSRQWVVKGFTGPVCNGIATDLARTPLLLPSGFGWRIRGVPGPGSDAKPWTRTGDRLAIGITYPGREATMPWFAYAGETGGLYFGSHDPRFGAKTLSARYDPQRRTFGAAFQHLVFVRPGETQALPPTVVMPYAGTWHTAARVYRAWFESVDKPLPKPAWTRTASGWLLAILKQQNGDILWPYESLGKLSEIAGERGLDILGLFGWGYGGHDHLYPDYNPCPLMGGEQALRDGIKEAHARGKRVVLYANGQLEERGTAYWTTTGRHLAVTRPDGSTVQEFWHKYKNTPGYHFDIGCQATPGWRERMLALAVQANGFGADGILFDQLGVRGPTACYAPHHGHPVPFMSYEADRKEMLRGIAEHLRGINPDFAILTEGFHDSILDSVAYFHGCVRGTFQDSAELVAKRLLPGGTEDLFPELLRYTHPEVASTIRFPSPLMDRPMVNYTCAFGWRFEIEARYLPDRDYLVAGRIPALEDYGLVLSKPDIRLVRTLPATDTAAYLKQAADFMRRHADLLMNGRFTDSQGFSCNGPGVLAKGFRTAGKLGVLLWNTTGEPAAFRLSVPGGQLLEADQPEGGTVEPLADLPPQSVRLLVWKTTGEG